MYVYTHDSTKAHETLFIYGPSIAPSPKKQIPLCQLTACTPRS